MRRRAAASLTLVVIGSAALHGCGDDKVAARDLYRTRGDCQRDWGDDPSKCEALTTGPHSGFFYGPTYHTSGPHTSSAARSGSHAMSTHVSRGGFGSSASAHGASS